MRARSMLLALKSLLRSVQSLGLQDRFAPDDMPSTIVRAHSKHHNFALPKQARTFHLQGERGEMRIFALLTL